ncbi:MAG: YceH family protein [Acidobacteriota bacterium]
MRVTLTPEEVRVLGSLVEKSVTTPEYYPLSLVAVTAACNQKSSRDPVVSYEAPVVQAALHGLRDKHLLWVVSGPDSRVPKYKHRFREAFDLSEAEAAALCLLLLRGPQTAGEIKGRAERLFSFREVAEVESTLEGLSRLEEGPLCVRLPRQPGRKEARWAHTLAGMPDTAEVSRVEDGAAPLLPPAPSVLERLASLEEEARSLREEVRALRVEVDELRAFRNALE